MNDCGFDFICPILIIAIGRGHHVKYYTVNKYHCSTTQFDLCDIPGVRQHKKIEKIELSGTMVVSSMIS